ncbi:hypothetical protein SeMB42_g01506 [Synchytrium endobioticum]|uniref:RNA helicase n=1 Tax=Synchytrium endobioticum TaxID=286115 RepID=A0A507DM97_9FUNG|nr:hypothetical protein SeMB42_g01506 [Synchytrium endobioticum]
MTTEDRKEHEMSPDVALAMVENTWRSLRPRWMDIIGDYAGQELFVLEGDALLEYILDNSLLQLARPGDPSFQLMHAVWLLEKTLHQFVLRDCNFEIVFFETNRHLHLGTESVVNGRLLARSILIRELNNLPVNCHHFQNLDDPDWQNYYEGYRPMFLLSSDGGTSSESTAKTAFLLRIMSHGLPVALLNPIEFKDGVKVMTMIYDQQVNAAQKAAALLILKSLLPVSISAVSNEPTNIVDSKEVIYRASEIFLRSVRDPLSDALLFLYLAHFQLLRKIPLADRAQQLDVNDDLDGRVFYLLVIETISTPHISLEELLGLFRAHFCITNSRQNNSHSVTKNSIESTDGSMLLPFSNPVFEKHLRSVQVTHDTSTAHPEEGVGFLKFGSVFLDDKHWHNSKPIVDEKFRHKSAEWLQKRKLREQQKYMAFMHAAAASLTGASGTVLDKKMIPLVGKRLSDIVRTSSLSTSSKPSKQSRQQAVSKSSKAEQIRASNTAKRDADERKDNSKWWNDQLIMLKTKSITEQINIVQHLLKVRKWISDPKKNDPNVGDDYRVLVARITVEVVRNVGCGKVSVNAAQGKILLEILASLNLTCMIPEGVQLGEDMKQEGSAITATTSKSAGKKKPVGKTAASAPLIKNEEVCLSFIFAPLFQNGKLIHEFMKLREDPIEFQLRCMGEYMVRSLDSRPDPRVDFEPDGWQIEVLDRIDNDESILIVAPTSSGKTFISFAAMERVLRESDDGIVVYVAPTKALVNQVAAEVFARFAKTIPSMNLWAIHTRDYRINDPHNCQILITVPYILSTMLLSPAIAKTFTSRIRRVILDEIHCISEEGAGGVWEQIILMNPAPVIGLSATVGEPERFAGWLKAVEIHSGRKFAFIHHKHRYNALRMFAYTPRLPARPLGPLKEHEPKSGMFAHVHPMSALEVGNSCIPADLALEPRDTLSLWYAMVKAGVPLEPKAKPCEFFARTSSVAIKNVIEYEAYLKTSLIRCLDAPITQAAYQKTIHILANDLRSNVSVTTIDQEAERFYDLFLPLLHDLNAQGWLPAVIFSFDRSVCEKILQKLVEELLKGEAEFKANSTEYQKMMKRVEEEEVLRKARAKKLEAMKRNSKKEESLDIDDDTGLQFDPTAPLAEFSFTGKGLSQKEFEQDIKGLAYLNLPAWVIEGLRRGMGVHHAGMNRRYRTLVENYFRRGVLRVVIATGTLSLGINAPAKTCVFAGDSVYLTALNFRQCAGRAGRRGFDLLGHVVFVGVSLSRIQRLILSRLPKLVATFPLTATLIARIFNLLNGAPGVEYPQKIVEKLLTLPQLSLDNEFGQEQLQHFVRFSIEYLRRVGLLDVQGRPLDLYGMVAYLYQHEPSNFAIAALFNSGALHRLTADIDNHPQETMQNLCLVLAHLFGRVYRSRYKPEILEALIKGSASAIVLPPLPKDIRTVLENHNKSVVTVFTNYCRQYAKQYSSQLGIDDALPWTCRKLTAELAGTSDSRFASTLTSSKTENWSRSAFVATSGHGESYGSVEEIVESSRAGLALPKRAMPSVFAKEDTELQLDAYACDFLRHGSTKVLVRDNGIRAGDCWFLLQDFDITIAAISETLQRLMKVAGNELNDDVEATGFDDIEPDGDEDEAPLPDAPMVGEENLRLLKAVNLLRETFHAKFKAIWA